MRRKLPFGIAQIGKAFRNEISPGNFTYRMREFEQMEMQYFIDPETETQWFDYWRERALAVVSRAGHAAEQPPVASARPRRAGALRAARRWMSITLSPLAGRRWRASTTAPTSTCAAHAEFSGKDLTLLRRPRQAALRAVHHRDGGGRDRAALAFLLRRLRRGARSRARSASCCGSQKAGAGQGGGHAALAERGAGRAGA